MVQKMRHATIYPNGGWMAEWHCRETSYEYIVSRPFERETSREICKIPYFLSSCACASCQTVVFYVRNIEVNCDNGNSHTHTHSHSLSRLAQNNNDVKILHICTQNFSPFTISPNSLSIFCSRRLFTGASVSV